MTSRIHVLCSNFKIKCVNLESVSLLKVKQVCDTGRCWLSRAAVLGKHSTGYRPQSSPTHSHHINTEKRMDYKEETKSAALYVHWPYCERRCSYCNFNKYISRNVDEERIERCLLAETETLIKLSGIRTVNSVFFGGGTPSLASPNTLGRILETVRRHAALSEDAEVTMEVNPTPSTANKLSDFKSCGINRLSVGVQSLYDRDLKMLGRDHTAEDAISDFKSCGINRLSVGVQSLYDRDLKMLGRDHTAEDAIRCIEVGRALFPWKVSVDLIFGRHRQTVESWREELEQILPLLHGHLSLYQLTVERGTQLFKQVTEGKYIIPSEEELCDMYTLSLQLLQSHGLHRYEVSNFAAKGCESDHNRSYWDGKQYIGVGPGAHGRFVPVNDGVKLRQSRIQTLEPDNWMYEVEQRGHGTRKTVDLTPVDRLEEMLMTGLRTRHGISHSCWDSLCSDGPSMSDLCYNSQQLEHLLEVGLLLLNDRGLCVSSEGLLVLDSVLPHLISSLYQLTR